MTDAEIRAAKRLLVFERYANWLWSASLFAMLLDFVRDMTGLTLLSIALDLFLVAFGLRVVCWCVRWRREAPRK
jgi:hypothetical protein